jgi:hypothetical protein
VNDVGDEINATPALGGGHLYVRTRGAMYCLAQPAVATAMSGSARK